MRFAHFLTFTLVGLVLASAAQAKDAHCTAARADVAAMSAKLPIEVDAATNTVAATADCDAKRVAVQRTVDLKLARMESDFKDFLQNQDNKAVCGNKSRRALLDAGWQWLVAYKFQEGDTVEIKAKCAK